MRASHMKKPSPLVKGEGWCSSGSEPLPQCLQQPRHFLFQITHPHQRLDLLPAPRTHALTGNRARLVRDGIEGTLEGVEAALEGREAVLVKVGAVLALVMCGARMLRGMGMRRKLDAGEVRGGSSVARHPLAFRPCRMHACFAHARSTHRDQSMERVRGGDRLATDGDGEAGGGVRGVWGWRVVGVLEAVDEAHDHTSPSKAPAALATVSEAALTPPTNASRVGG